MTAQRAEAFTFDGGRVELGETEELRYSVSKTDLGNPVRIPITIINGPRPGPTTFLPAAIHGDELNGIEVVREAPQERNYTNVCVTTDQQNFRRFSRCSDMDKVRIDDIDGQLDSATIKRPLTDAINAADVALNYYELAPGDSFAYGYHMHRNQEEIFVIQEGRVTFETKDGEIVATAGEVIRFEPGEYQQGINEDDERVVAVAIGAPQEAGESEILRECGACGERTPNTVERSEDGQAKITRCLDCGTETGRFD